MTSGANKILIKIISLFVICVYLAVPFFTGNYITYVITLMSIMVIVTQGLNVMIGFAGLFSFGQPGFMAFGAYFSAILAAKIAWIPFPVLIIITGIASAGLGIVIGFPCLRLSGFYLAMATFGFSAALFVLINDFSPLTGGNEGMSVPAPVFGVLRLGSAAAVFYIVAITALLIQLGVRNIWKTKTGRAWNAIRDDEIAASSMGINIQNEKLKVFALGAFLAGVAGVFYAYLIRYLQADFFSIMGLSLFLILVAGGIGTIYGPIFGSIFITLIPQIFGGVFSKQMNLVFGIILVLFILLAPGGFYGIWYRITGKAKSAFNLRETITRRFFSGVKKNITDTSKAGKSL
ncbi:MAG: branched-chain amino acid ABC transporter permease [Spirochaetota bacterium]